MKTKSELVGDDKIPAEMTGTILDINGVPFDPIWTAEFRGFFWGEGTIGIYRNNPKQKKWRGTVYASAGIGLRTDDEPVLIEFQNRIGGTLLREKYKKYPNRTVSRWRTANIQSCKLISNLLKGGSVLSFNKKKQLGLWTEAVDVLIKGGRYTPEEHQRFDEISVELRRLKDWDK